MHGPDAETGISGLRALSSDAVALLAETVLALRETAEPAYAWSAVASALRRAAGATDTRLLRLDRRSGALFRIEESGVETSYLSEPGGPIEAAMHNDAPVWDDGSSGARAMRETLLWTAVPGSMATVPLAAGGAQWGFLLVARTVARPWGTTERRFVQSVADALASALERDALRRAWDGERARVASLERRLQGMRESASQLLSVVAQEVRAPLAAIKAYAESLSDHLDNPLAPRERFLRIIGEESDRLARVVTDVQDLSRIEGGECPLRLRSLALEDLGREACIALLDQASERGVRFESHIEPGVRAEGDGELLTRALVNLIEHALAHAPAGSKVTLELGRSGEEWVGAVADQGPPLPADRLSAVLEGYPRGRQEDVAAGGERLGLAIARGILELHGGRLWAETPSGGDGARLAFATPLLQTASPRARRIARQTAGREDLQSLFDAIVEMVAASLETGIVSLMMVDPDRGDLYVAAGIGLSADGTVERRTTIRSGVSGAVAAWGRPLLVENIETDRRFKRLNHPQYRTKSLLCVPLRVEGEVIGVINANNKTNGQPFDEDDLGLLSMLAERVGSSIERACAYPDSSRAIDDALDAVRCMTRLKRELSLGGRRHVRLARAVARELGLAPSDVDVLGYVASIHDLGMVRFASEAAAARRLDEPTRVAMSGHPEVSVEILRPLEFLGVVREIILAHHERWDGAGYPHGLEGEAIPIGARILAVVDAWESMTSHRPWRAPLSGDEACEELRRESGGQFDAQVVEAFLRVVGRDAGDLRAAA